MEAHAARSPRGGQRDDGCSFWYTLIRYFSPMKPAQTPPAPPASNLRPPPRRLRKRRRPSRPPLPILCDVISVEHELVSKDNSWAAAHYVLEDSALELDLQGECQEEGDECDLLLCCHLNQFVPHTLETIEEVDGEHAYGQGSNAALERQLGNRSLGLGEAEVLFETLEREHTRLPVGLPQRNTMYPFSINSPVPPVEGLW